MSDLGNPLEEESRTAERYEAWKQQGAIAPFGYSFMGLLLLGVAGCFKAREVWNSPMWPVVLLLGGLFATGIVSLFLDLPRRQLSPASRVFLGLGVFVIAALGVMNVLARWF